MEKRIAVEIGGRTMVFESGKLARQAGGSVLVTYGETVVLATAVSDKQAKPDLSFLPLTIEYQERFYAAGRIPGSYFRREIGRPTEKEVLTCRLIDRPLRPLFPKNYRCETQVIATVLSSDKENDPDILAMNGASAALSISDIPLGESMAAVRIGFLDDKFVVNPTQSQLNSSRMDLVVAGTRSAVVMVEGRIDQMGETQVLDAILYAHEVMQPLLDVQEALREAMGKPKREVAPVVVNETLRQQVESLAADGLAQVIVTADKQERSRLYDVLKTAVIAKLVPEACEKEAGVVELLDAFRKRLMRERIVRENIRIDGRRLDQVRPIASEIACLPRTHGSALFTRGETQAIVICTLGSDQDQQRVEELGGEVNRRFMLHYNFPPFCVGEVRPLRGPSRRDIGHGNLARRGIMAVLPDENDFPYTIRIVSEVLESNGSSSMATVCGSSLALMDAGVPLSAPVSGVAMGLIKEGEDVAVLTDILGDEDHLGDMDFKVVGTASGVTALQMDIKIKGVNREILGRALEQARQARLHILERMAATIKGSREDVARHAPKFNTMHINPDKIRELIGPGGKVIRELTATYEAKIDVDDDGTVKLFTSDGEVGEALVARIREIVAEAEVGAIYEGVVRSIKDFGAFVEIMPGTDGLVHISELAPQRVERVTDILKEGDTVRVKVLEIDGRGRVRLSRKACLES